MVEAHHRCLPAPLPCTTGAATAPGNIHSCAEDCLYPTVVTETRISEPVRRQAIVALADARIALNTIAKLVRCSLSSVRRWVQRAKGAGELHDHARSGRPAIYPQELQMRIVAFTAKPSRCPAPEDGR